MQCTRLTLLMAFAVQVSVVLSQPLAENISCWSSCSSCPAVLAVDPWLVAQGFSFPERVAWGLGGILPEKAAWFWGSALPPTCMCRTARVRSFHDCELHWLCEAPCENSAFGNLLEANEHFRTNFSRLGNLWYAWGPSFYALIEVVLFFRLLRWMCCCG